jgi:hypothetical protein
VLLVEAGCHRSPGKTERDRGVATRQILARCQRDGWDLVEILLNFN